PYQPQEASGSSSPERARCSNTPRRASGPSQALSYHNASIVRAPSASYDHASLCYFVSRFASPDPTDGYPGHLSFLPGIYDGHKHGLLETATLSVAQMASYNRFGGERFKVESYQNYGRAIRMLRDTMRSEDQATDDKVIAAILLLCTLKDVSGEESGDPNEHAPGLFYLIEKRGMEQMATSRGSELLFLALVRLVSALNSTHRTVKETGLLTPRSKCMPSSTRTTHTPTPAPSPHPGGHLTPSSAPWPRCPGHCRYATSYYPSTNSPTTNYQIRTRNSTTRPPLSRAASRRLTTSKHGTPRPPPTGRACSTAAGPQLRSGR
ncbi:hypothetical protein IMZ48_33735, partial [Candidatus Bathyarchaeota archaeon]|nr:hypothetical protein [Candidatus Bathyarchaeota archaeon]